MPHTSQNDKTQLLTRGPVLRAIASIAIPMVLVMVVNAVFSYLDLWFIARLGPDALHAMDVLFPYVSLSNALVYAGLGTGVSVVVARQATCGGASWEGVLKAASVGDPAVVDFRVGRGVWQRCTAACTRHRCQPCDGWHL